MIQDFRSAQVIAFTKQTATTAFVLRDQNSEIQQGLTRISPRDI